MNPNTPFFRGDGPRGNGMAFYDHGGPGAIGWTIFALQIVAVLGIAWLLASLLLGRFGRRPAAPTPVLAGPAGPLETLHMRYARGEIGRDDYLQARSDLGAGPEEPTQT